MNILSTGEERGMIRWAATQKWEKGNPPGQGVIPAEQEFPDVDAYGVLTQEGAAMKKPVGYSSTLQDPVSRGWSVCLQAIVATALLIEEARKVTFSAPLKVYTPHNVRGVLQQKAEKWLTDSRILKYEAIFIDSPDLEFKVTTAQSPAQFLYREPQSK